MGRVLQGKNEKKKIVSESTLKQGVNTHVPSNDTMSSSGPNEKMEKEEAPAWIESENIDRHISETCELYGIEEHECACITGEAEQTEEDGDDVESVESGADAVPLQRRVTSQLHVIRETGDGEILWKCPMHETGAIANHLVATSKLVHRLPCHSFRSMLPPLEGGKCIPTQNPGWLRCCMRGTLFAALHGQSSEGIMPTGAGMINRYPEHVYCWLENDNDRWGYYHSVKASSERNPEAWLAFTLLDDMQGRDFFYFLSCAIERIQNHVDIGRSLELSLSKTSQSQLADAFLQQGRSMKDDADCCALNIWIPSVEICTEVIYQLFGNDELLRDAKSSEIVEELSAHVDQIAVDLYEDSPESTNDIVTASAVCCFALLQLIMKAYLKHKEKRITLMRLMFQTASEGVLTDFYDKACESYCPGSEEDVINVPQLYQILRTISPSTTLNEATAIYRESYDVLYPPSQWGNLAPAGITFKSFLDAADKARTATSSIFFRALFMQSPDTILLNEDDSADVQSPEVTNQ